MTDTGSIWRFCFKFSSPVVFNMVFIQRQPPPKTTVNTPALCWYLVFDIFLHRISQGKRICAVLLWPYIMGYTWRFPRISSLILPGCIHQPSEVLLNDRFLWNIDTSAKLATTIVMKFLQIFKSSLFRKIHRAWNALLLLLSLWQTLTGKEQACKGELQILLCGFCP